MNARNLWYMVYSLSRAAYRGDQEPARIPKHLKRAVDYAYGAIGEPDKLACRWVGRILVIQQEKRNPMSWRNNQPINCLCVTVPVEPLND